MSKYFYSDGTNRFGPLSLEELRRKDITKSTLVWFDGMSDWQAAGTVPELNEIFTSTPPPPPVPSTNYNTNSNYNRTEQTNTSKPPKTWLVESILATLFCCMPFGIAGIVYASRVESLFYIGDIAGANKASADAKKWTMVSLWIGVGVGVLYVLFMIAGIASGF